MFRGIYTATSGMLASSRRQQMLTNNLANAETPGFKQDQTVMRAFPDILISRIRDDQGLQVAGKPSLQGSQPLGVLHTGVYTQEAIPSFLQGAIKETNRFIDFALVDQSMPVNAETGKAGSLFFAVQKGEGEIRYTRNGQFTVDPEGFLTTAEGYYVLNENQQRIQVGQEPFYLTEDGRIIRDPENASSFANAERLLIAYTEQPERLVKEGQGLFRYVGAGEGQPVSVRNIDFSQPPFNLATPDQVPYQVLQGFLEGSNVDTTQTMTEMLAMYRLFEANQKVLQSYDRSLEKTVNEVGKVF